MHPSRTPVIAGNWKMNPAPDALAALLDGLRASIAAVPGVERVVCPPFVYLHTVTAALAGTEIGVGAQNVHWAETGAFTGEVAAPMLTDLARYAIIGHSERRQFFGETDERVRDRTAAALKHGLIPITCIGETLDEREANQTEAVLRRQVEQGLGGLDLPSGFIVAYEPVWAIGTGRAATPEMAQEACAFVRATLAAVHGDATASAARILYGGSMTAANAASLLDQPDIDGGLVGGASLKPDEFAAIVQAAAARLGG
ncbi:MAG: triose-phosphate isomerase [Caulobacteraceae bacterium]|nr:triose-phosphate isomerase [Caulobacteraceae bacterium]